MIRTMGIAGLLALGGIAGAAVAEDPESVVNWRKNTIGAAGRAAVALNDIRKGDLEEQDRITEIAEMMVISAKLAKEAFRHDTRGASVETTAKDTIWTNWDGRKWRVTGTLIALTVVGALVVAMVDPAL